MQAALHRDFTGGTAMSWGAGSLHQQCVQQGIYRWRPACFRFRDRRVLVLTTSMLGESALLHRRHVVQMAVLAPGVLCSYDSFKMQELMVSWQLSFLKEGSIKGKSRTA